MTAPRKVDYVYLIWVFNPGEYRTLAGIALSREQISALGRASKRALGKKCFAVSKARTGVVLDMVSSLPGSLAHGNEALEEAEMYRAAGT